MPLYHFNMNDESPSDAVELDDTAAARCEALKLSGQLICEQHPDTFWDSGEWTMTVTDADHLVLFQLTLFGTEAPATQKHRALGAA